NGMPRKEGTFGAIYWWMVKVGQALAIILSGVILKYVGFDQNISVQAAETMTQLRVADIIVPASTAALAFIVMWRYNLNEETVNRIGIELKKRKYTPQSSGSIYQNNKSLSSLSSLNLQPNPKYDLDFSNKSPEELQQLFTTTLEEGLHGMCFSPYLEGQDLSHAVSEEQVIRRMKIIKPYTQWVRSFSCANGNEFIPKVAKKHNLKTMVGASISADKEQNDKEIAQLVKLAKAGYVDIAVVGNEVLLREELTVDDVLRYILKVKTALPNIPVGYVDSYFIFTDNPSLIKACDLVLINCYPFWEGASVEVSPSFVRQMYAMIKDKAEGKPIVITETGWPSEGNLQEKAEPSKENAMKYFININNWATTENIDLFYFSSFDEAWKIHHEGDVGQRWGIWNEKEKLKF
ncbi:MAG: MFS transporter, partial [Flavobacteriaceae bacterium]|nr:MFS transporter [Flavobacteriaceae bacterium]